jgi:UDP-glucose 4-epimerase
MHESWPNIQSISESGSLVHGPSPCRPVERVVVLGARGFVGAALSQKLVQRNIPLLPISSLDLDLSAKGSAQALTQRLRPTDTVVLLSAVKSGRSLDATALRANLAMAAAVSAAVKYVQCRQVVYLSSDSVYPLRDGKISEKTLARATSLYSEMHCAREAILSALQQPVALLRVSQIYGAGDRHNAYGPNRMARSALAEGRVFLFGRGEDSRDHIFIDDVIAVLMEVIARNSSGLINVANGVSHSFAEIARIVSNECPRPVVTEYVERQMQVMHRSFDVALLRRMFPTVRSTPLNEGVSSLVSDLRRRSARM